MATTVDTDLSQAAQWFHALSDTTRLEIVQMLSSGERCVCELTDALDAAQSRLSFHLKVLKEAGIVTDRREGRWVYYTLNADTFAELTAVLASLGPSHRAGRTRGGLGKRIDARLNACCD